MNHLEEGLLHAWLDAETTPEQDERIQTHLEHCDACATLLDAAARDRAAATELVADLALPFALAEPGSAEGAEPLPEPATVDGMAARGAGAAGRTDWMRPLAWAASLVLAVALGWYARAPQQAQLVSAPELVAEAAAPAEAAAGAPRELRLAAGEMAESEEALPGSEGSRAEVVVSEDRARAVGTVAQSVADDPADARDDRDNAAASGAEEDANAAVALDATGALARKSLAVAETAPGSESVVALEEALAVGEAGAPVPREATADESPEAEASRAEFSAAPQRFRQAAPAAVEPPAAPSAAFADTEAVEGSAPTVGIRPSDAAQWLGGNPVLPARSEILDAALEPALELPEAQGGSPVVAFRVRLSDGSVVQIWQQNVAGVALGRVRADDQLDEPSEAPERRAGRAPQVVGATTGRDGRGMERASVRIGELLVVVQGEGAHRILETMAAARDPQR
jgi:hypothetical protein